MIWALLAVLGVPVWLILGALGAVIWSRRSFARQPGVLRAKVRPAEAESWPRRSAYVRLVHDVLVVNSGVALVRTEVHGFRTATVEPARQEQIRGLSHPVVLALELDDGSRSLLATEEPWAENLQVLARFRRPGEGAARHELE